MWGRFTQMHILLLLYAYNSDYCHVLTEAYQTARMRLKSLICHLSLTAADESGIVFLLIFFNSESSCLEGLCFRLFVRISPERV